MFETERLRLRAIRKSDIEKIVAMRNDYRIQSMLTLDYVVPGGPKMEEEVYKGTELLYVIIETKENDEFVGFTILFGAQAKNRDAKFGIALLPEFWGRGFGMETLRFVINYGFEELGLHRITLNVFENNPGAIRLYKKAGFVQEGIQRKANWSNGKWSDVIWMGILAEDWAASKH